MKNKQQEKILNIVLIFIVLQPIFDILSFLSIRNIIPFNISTYVKPLFVFLLAIYMFFKGNNKKIWIIYSSAFMIFLIGHFYILYKLFIPTSMILHEFRFVVNIAYMIAFYIILSNLYKNCNNKKHFLRILKRTILLVFSLYFSLLFVSVLTQSSAMTYEYADKAKKGFKGWFDSGQILGHAFSIMFPLLIYVVLTPKRKWYIRIPVLLIFIIGVSLLGTKVPYYITIIVLILYLIINSIVKLLNKSHEINYFNLLFVSILLIGMFITYPYTPVYYNTELNKRVASISVDEYDINNESGLKDTLSEEELKKLYPNKDITRLVEYHKWSKQSSEYLNYLFESEIVHPSNTRTKQIHYANKKYSLSSFEYKLFGLGFLNQDTSFALESDFFMALYSFGILGFILFLSIPMYYFIKYAVFILKNLKRIDLETYMLYMGLGVFFCISIYAGYTYIYTNFSLFLVILLTMLKLKIDMIQNGKIKKNKVSFLLLHLGYGGIETATINTANALCDKYEIELVSFYKLSNNQTNKIDNKIQIRYLYNGSPNKEEFMNSLKEHKYLTTLKEGIKSVYILFNKKIRIIKYIINCDSKFLISTRWDFSIYLSKYGNKQTIKIAQEHHYHNNDKKYLNILKNKYSNIDYLFALTKTLENDYKKLLSKNNHTKIVLVPNMLFDIPNLESDLNGKNIITVSRLDYGKKNNDIIKAFSKIDDKSWKLNIIGDGAEFANLNNLVKELNLENRVTLTGYKNKQEIEEYMLKSSVFLMASLTEGLPMVLLEAMSYGIPCIAYETASGVSDIIDNNSNGFIIKDRNESEYIDKINLIIKDEKKRKEMGRNAKKTVNNFSKTEIKKIWLNILK